MNTKPIDASYVFCKILLAFPKDYIYIPENGHIISLLKSHSNKPPYTSFLGRVAFESKMGIITCPAIDDTLEQMKGFMLAPVEGVPHKYAINKAEIADFISKFSNQEPIDDTIIKKLAKDIERKINSLWDYKTIKNQFEKNKETVYIPASESKDPIEEKILDSVLSDASISRSFKEEINSLGIFGDVEPAKESSNDLIEGL